MLGIRRLRIVGDSMSPTLENGKLILTRPYLPWENVAKDDMIAFVDSRNKLRLVVKRVLRHSDDSFFVVGDNAQKSTDSRDFGNIKHSSIVGKVFYY